MYIRTPILSGELEEKEADKGMRPWPAKWGIRILSSLKRKEESVPRRKFVTVSNVSEFRKLVTKKHRLISTKKLVPSMEAVLGRFAGSIWNSAS